MLLAILIVLASACLVGCALGILLELMARSQGAAPNTEDTP